MVEAEGKELVEVDDQDVIQGLASQEGLDVVKVVVVVVARADHRPHAPQFGFDDI